MWTIFILNLLVGYIYNNNQCLDSNGWTVTFQYLDSKGWIVTVQCLDNNGWTITIQCLDNNSSTSRQ